MLRHVLCVFPYRVGSRPSMRLPPLGLETIAAALEPYAEAVDIIDLRWEQKGTADFLRPDTDLVCFSVNWDWEPGLVRKEIRSVPPNVRVIVGGRHATGDPEKLLSDCPNVDILVRGDGEETIDEIARGKPLSKIVGLSYRLDGRIVHNPVRQWGRVCDDIYPNRRLRRYVYALPSDGHGGLEVDCVASSRGCPFNCKFCSQNRNPWGSKRNWSARSAESVVREIEEIDAQLIGFVDDNFAHNMDRVGAICDLIMQRGIRKRYGVVARVEVAKRPDVLRKMERAGFSILSVGIESAQDKTLRSMQKGFNIRQLRKYFRVLRKTRMLLNGSFIVGNIGETEKEMLEMGTLARELGLDTISVMNLRNMPYTGLEALVAQNPGYHIAPDGDIYSDEYAPKRLREIRRAVCRIFYTPGQFLRILSKGLRNRLLTPTLLTRIPAFLVRKTLKWRRRKRPERKRAGPYREAAS